MRPAPNPTVAQEMSGTLARNIWEDETRVSHRVTLIPGDGTGPELAEATRRVLDATGVAFDWDVQEAGVDVMEQHGGNPLPDDVVESIRRNGTALKAPITTPVGTGFRGQRPPAPGARPVRAFAPASTTRACAPSSPTPASTW